MSLNSSRRTCRPWRPGRGRTGDLALYRLMPRIDRILVRALRYQRESGYKN